MYIHKYMNILPDRVGVAVKIEDGFKLGDVAYMLQVINGIVQFSLPIFVKVDQSGSTCNGNHGRMDGQIEHSNLT